jgi:uncharacterized protein YcfL
MKKTGMRILVVLACLLAATAGTGCLRGRPTSGVTTEQGRLIIEDPAFAMNLELVHAARTKTDEGFLHAQATLKNTNRDDYRCQYQFTWFDEAGLALKHARTPWRPLVLHGRETKELDAVAPIEGAEDFLLKIRRAD